MEVKCANIYDKREADHNYTVTPEEEKLKVDLVDYYMDPKSFLEKKF